MFILFHLLKVSNVGKHLSAASRSLVWGMARDLACQLDFKGGCIVFPGDP